MSTIVDLPVSAKRQWKDTRISISQMATAEAVWVIPVADTAACSGILVS